MPVYRLACRNCVSNCTLRARGIALPGQRAILLPCFYDRQHAAGFPFCPREGGTAPPHPVPSRTALFRRSFFHPLWTRKGRCTCSALFSSNSTSGKAQTVPATFPARPPRSRSAGRPRSCGAGDGELALLPVFAAHLLVAADHIFVGAVGRGLRLPLLIAEKDSCPGALAQDDLAQFLEDDLSVLLIFHCEIIDGFAQNCLPCERAPGTCTVEVKSLHGPPGPCHPSHGAQSTHFGAKRQACPPRGMPAARDRPRCPRHRAAGKSAPSPALPKKRTGRPPRPGGERSGLSQQDCGRKGQGHGAIRPAQGRRSSERAKRSTGAKSSRRGSVAGSEGR